MHSNVIAGGNAACVLSFLGPGVPISTVVSPWLRDIEKLRGYNINGLDGKPKTEAFGYKPPRGKP